jgi:Na+/H+ antiporter NhaD/arsenite permease-like protein
MMLGPIAAVILAVFLLCLRVFYGRAMQVAPHLKDAMLSLNPRDAVQDPVMLKKCVWLLMGINLAFCLHSTLHLEPATIALLGASAFMLIGHAKKKPEADELSYLADVEWKTIFFFIGLFILVGGLVKVGVIGGLASQLVSVTHGHVGHGDPVGVCVSLGNRRQHPLCGGDESSGRRSGPFTASRG